jgi:hypothetical protein
MKTIHVDLLVGARQLASDGRHHAEQARSGAAPFRAPSPVLTADLIRVASDGESIDAALDIAVTYRATAVPGGCTIDIGPMMDVPP